MTALCTIFLLCFTTFITPSKASAPKLTKDEFVETTLEMQEEFYENRANPEWFADNVTIDEYGQMLFEKNGITTHFSDDAGVMIIHMD